MTVFDAWLYGNCCTHIFTISWGGCWNPPESDSVRLQYLTAVGPVWMVNGAACKESNDLKVLAMCNKIQKYYFSYL